MVGNGVVVVGELAIIRQPGLLPQQLAQREGAFSNASPLVSADQACPNAIANETTTMHAKAKFRFMKFSSKACVMAPS